MAWQHASADGGPAEPPEWVLVGADAGYARDDADLADADRRLLEQERVTAELRRLQQHVESLESQIRTRRRRAAWFGVSTPADALGALRAAAMMAAGRTPTRPPTRRTRGAEAIARCEQALAATLHEIHAAHGALAALGGPRSDLLRAAERKAERMRSERAEGWAEADRRRRDVESASLAYSEVRGALDRWLELLDTTEAALASYRAVDAIQPTEDDAGDAHRDAEVMEARKAAITVATEATDAARLALETLHQSLQDIGLDPSALRASGPLTLRIRSGPYQPPVEGRMETLTRTFRDLRRQPDVISELQRLRDLRAAERDAAEDAFITYLRRPV